MHDGRQISREPLSPPIFHHQTRQLQGQACDGNVKGASSASWRLRGIPRRQMRCGPSLITTSWRVQRHRRDTSRLAKGTTAGRAVDAEECGAEAGGLPDLGRAGGRAAGGAPGRVGRRPEGAAAVGGRAGAGAQLGAPGRAPGAGP